VNLHTRRRRFLEKCIKLASVWLKLFVFLHVVEDRLYETIAEEISREEGNVATSALPLSVPTIHIEMSEPSEPGDLPSCQPEQLHRVDRPPLRTPKVAGNNTLVIQQDHKIVFGSPKPAPRRHDVVQRTLSADSYRLSRTHLACDSFSPALSVASSIDKRSRASSFSDRSRVSSVGRRSADCDYVDDFDESSDVDEGCKSLHYYHFLML